MIYFILFMLFFKSVAMIFLVFLGFYNFMQTLFKNIHQQGENSFKSIKWNKYIKDFILTHCFTTYKKNCREQKIKRHFISPDPIGGVGESPKSISSSLSARVSAHECSAASSSPVVTIVSAQLKTTIYIINIIFIICQKNK